MFHTKVFIKKSHTCEINGTRPRISNFYISIFLHFRCLHTSIFILAIAYCNILSAVFITIIITVLLSQKISLLLSHIKPTDFIILDNLQAAFLPRWMDGRLEEKTIFSTIYVITLHYKNTYFLFVQAGVSVFFRC